MTVNPPPPADGPTHGALGPWAGLLDDAATFPPGDAPLDEALRAFQTRRGEWYADLVGSFVVRDTDLGSVPDTVPVSVVLTTGAGAVEGVVRLTAKRGLSVAGLEVSLRDLDDLAGNARRVIAAVRQSLDDGHLAEDVPVHVELPQAEPTPGWLAAADEVAAAELRLKFRTGGVEAHLFPSPERLASWIDAALDRETPFKCTAGLHHAVRHTSAAGFQHHGFLNVLLATRATFDGASHDEVVATLEERDAETVAARVRESDVARTRRWFTSHGSCSVLDPLDDLTALGLLEGPR